MLWAGIAALPTLDPAPTGRPTCYRCLRPQRCCVCGSIQPVDHRTPVVVVQHPRERRHPFGTVRLARLGLRRVRVHVASRGADGLTRCPPCAPAGAVLLYPTPDALPIDALPRPPAALVVVDGTWSTAHKLVRDNPWLAALPTVRLAPPRPGRYRIRRAPRPAVQLSTIEAIALALIALEPDNERLTALLAAFDDMVEHQLALEHHHRR
ncbi:MAG: DTW domain-containing protein [Myxococcales bacterium]|nr:DTW domain-containing protein [Myxococcales bacterium]